MCAYLICHRLCFAKLIITIQIEAERLFGDPTVVSMNLKLSASGKFFFIYILCILGAISCFRTNIRNRFKMSCKEIKLSSIHKIIVQERTFWVN